MNTSSWHGFFMKKSLDDKVSDKEKKRKEKEKEKESVLEVVCTTVSD